MPDVNGVALGLPLPTYSDAGAANTPLVLYLGLDSMAKNEMQIPAILDLE